MANRRSVRQIIDDVPEFQFLWAGLAGLSAAAAFSGLVEHGDAATVSLVGLLAGSTVFLLWLVVHHFFATVYGKGHRSRKKDGDRAA